MFFKKLAGQNIFNIISAIGILGSLVISYQNLDYSKEDNKKNFQTTLENLKLSAKKLDNDFFSSMLKNISSKKYEIRIGGIYGLINLGNSNEEFYWPVYHTLLSYLQNYYSKDKRLSTPLNSNRDVKAIMHFLTEGRNNYTFNESEGTLDLSNLYLQGIHINSGKLIFANFSNSILENVSFNNSDLTNTNFNLATLYNVDFTGSNLEHALFAGTIFNGGDFSNTNLTKISFESALFKGIFNFNNAVLKRSILCQPDEICKNGLTCDDFIEVLLYDSTKISENFKKCNFKKIHDPDFPA